MACGDDRKSGAGCDRGMEKSINFTGDAHPVHLHLVHFEVLGRKALTFDEGEVPQTIVQHNGALGAGAVDRERRGGWRCEP